MGIKSGKKHQKTSAQSSLVPSEVFDVPENIKYLDSKELACLEAEFRNWKSKVTRADYVRSRTRVFCLFLVLRHTGAKLGEILGLDERESIDLLRAVIKLGKEDQQREVPLPQDVCRELKGLIDGPMSSGLEGRIFQLDPGYVRRAFYERAQACNLDRQMGGPSVLRRSRAVELLRNGVPLGVVRKVLGQSSADLSAVYQDWSAGDVKNIVRRMALEETALKTSARNTFIGHVTEVRRDGILADVEFETAEGFIISSVITLESLYKLDLEVGVPVSATIKAPLVAVRPVAGEAGSSRNCIPAKVTSLKQSEVLAEVSGESEGGSQLCALVTTWSIEEDGLKEGGRVEFCFKALSVVLHAV
ncbi:TOBE domain-containing protein [Maridesulfovibrio hydrothermalis]|uniref:TOBE domain protein n=1 Tax=Maridesulfovibrio hydrothermalis AM13 = DSM 14728 TaxID=1121451 RepID=L0R7J3_9BACT|nr:TOBE domain-containing protein [Maridesulfovibrio hydrothermalis]CCO22709.1 TOBE domain protein [Maridesulfovibrio hydrothermalis AM13 = DSM 14728]